MWVFSYPDEDGEIVERWLQPGKHYTVGRNRASDIWIRNDAISRSCLQLRVEDLPEKSAVRAGLVTRAFIKNLSTKHTKLNNKVMPENEERLVRNDSVVKIKDSSPFELKWINYVVTVSVSTEEFNKTAEKLAPLDVKVLRTMHTDTKCYVPMMSRTRSPKTLHAMVRGIPIVSAEFIDVLAGSATAMERDFKSMPNPEKYPLDPQILVDSRRFRMFRDLAVFCVDTFTYESALDMITTGRGKLYRVEVGKRTYDKVDTIVNFIKEHAGEREIVVLRPLVETPNEPNELLEPTIRACQQLNVTMKTGTSVYNAIKACDKTMLTSKGQASTGEVDEPVDMEMEIELEDAEEKKVAPKPPVAQRETTLDAWVKKSREPESSLSSRRTIKRRLPDDSQPKQAPEAKKHKSAIPEVSNTIIRSGAQRQAEVAAAKKAETTNVTSIDEDEQAAASAEYDEAPPVMSQLPPVAAKNRKGKKAASTAAPDLVPNAESEEERAEPPPLNFETMTLNQLQNLVIVEELDADEVPEHRAAPAVVSVAVESSGGVPNFKRFKKTPVTNKHPKVEYVNDDDEVIDANDKVDQIFVDVQQKGKKRRRQHESQSQQSQQESPLAPRQRPQRKRQKTRNETMWEGGSNDEGEAEPAKDYSDDDGDIFVPDSWNDTQTQEFVPELEGESGDEYEEGPKHAAAAPPIRPSPRREEIVIDSDDDDDDDDDDEGTFKFTS